MNYIRTKASVLVVTAALTTGIVMLATLLIVTATRSDDTGFNSSAGTLEVQTFASGLVNPWGLGFLPDGRLIVTERPGRIRIVSKDGTLSKPLTNVPSVYASRQSGLLDLALDRTFAENHTLYICYTPDNTGNIRLASAHLSDDERALDNIHVLFNQQGPSSSGLNLGCRIAQAADNNLFLSLGDHFAPRDDAQNLANHIGKIVRIAPDGSVPKDNPFVGRAGAKPEIWSYGNRNPQGLAVNPTTGELWETEHGPKGGDEVNIISAGKNYGWPVIGYGVDYDGSQIHESTHKEGMEQPLKYWVPSIAPSGLTFYEGSLFPQWRGNLFLGALAGKMLVRLSLDGDKVTGEERLLHNLDERIRDVRTGPDGALWLLTDNRAGRILRVTPQGH